MPPPPAGRRRTATCGERERSNATCGCGFNRQLPFEAQIGTGVRPQYANINAQRDQARLCGGWRVHASLRCRYRTFGWWVHALVSCCCRALGPQVRGHCLLLHLQAPRRELPQLHFEEGQSKRALLRLSGQQRGGRWGGQQRRRLSSNRCSSKTAKQDR